ncbi:H-2 class I histocompatibility antigen, Q8 alpha chain-like [Hoplias malabaricus]|uniref:H-2 class I histocompatibility antigen, Q8 alpha chain-like n=1 Tax=Hoplias malabaricus TaxID=27720 RepID=UPI0034635F73
MNFSEFTVVGLVDGVQIVYYDSKIRKMVSKAEWMKPNEENYWDEETQKCQRHEETFKVNMATAMQRFNQTRGIHTLQLIYGCELNDYRNKFGYMQFGYDGEDFLSLDLNAKTWTASNSKALITKQRWENEDKASQVKNYLENTCIDWLQKYVEYGRSTLEKKVPPEVDIFQKNSFAPVVCYATGFFPKDVSITWKKNGEVLHEDVFHGATLVNEDRTFQKRSVLTVSPEELDRDKYTCVIQHAGLSNDLTLRLATVDPFQGDSSCPVVCHATSSFPKPVVISRQRNGVTFHKNLALEKNIVSNGGTFQKTSVLCVSPEELNRNRYTCNLQNFGQENVQQSKDGSSAHSLYVVIFVIALIIFITFIHWIISRDSGQVQKGINEQGSIWAGCVEGFGGTTPLQTSFYQMVTPSMLDD